MGQLSAGATAPIGGASAGATSPIKDTSAGAGAPLEGDSTGAAAPFLEVGGVPRWRRANAKPWILAALFLRIVGSQRAAHSLVHHDMAAVREMPDSPSRLLRKSRRWGQRRLYSIRA